MKLSGLPYWVQVKWDAALQENPNLIGILGSWVHCSCTTVCTVFNRCVLFCLDESVKMQSTFSEEDGMNEEDSSLKKYWLLLDEAL